LFLGSVGEPIGLTTPFSTGCPLPRTPVNKGMKKGRGC
jgi:hypothetical protein